MDSGPGRGKGRYPRSRDYEQWRLNQRRNERASRARRVARAREMIEALITRAGLALEPDDENGEMIMAKTTSSKPMPPSYPQVNFRPGDILPYLAVRIGTGFANSLGDVAKRDLKRYYDMLRRSLPTFTDGEASLIVDALNGSLVQPYSAPLLWAEISDALEDGFADKWGVNGEALVARLRTLTPFEALAVEDAVERWWRSTQTEPDLTFEERHRLVGLVKL